MGHVGINSDRPDLTPDEVFIVRGAFTWGKGFSKDQALAAWKKAGGRGKNFEILKCSIPCTVFVNGMGDAILAPVTLPEGRKWVTVQAAPGKGKS